MTDNNNSIMKISSQTNDLKSNVDKIQKMVREYAFNK